MSGTTSISLHDSLSGQVALVTGANRGLGEAIAGQLVDHGATVYAGARDPEDVTAPDQRPIELDVTDETQIAAATDRIDDETGRLDVLVNNAGVFPESAPLHEMATDDLDRTLDVNLRGPTLVTRHALDLLLDRDGGRVVNMSSSLGQFSTGQMGGGYPPYRLSKAGLGGLTAYLDGEYGSNGLIANAACPGWVRTDMGGENATRSPADGADTPVWLARFAPGSPSGRFWKDREPRDW